MGTPRESVPAVAMGEPAVTWTGDGDSLQLYLQVAAREPLLTKDEEVELARAIEEGEVARAALRRGLSRSRAALRRANERLERGVAARQRFIRANLRLVVSVARRHQGQGLPLSDLIQEGNIGLMRAVELFDWRRGFKFSTYATWWIRQAITRAIVDRGRQIRLPGHVHTQVNKVRRASSELLQRTGRDPTCEELAEALDMPVEQVARILEARQREPVSLQTPVGDEGELGDRIQAWDDAQPDELEEEMLRVDVRRVLSKVLDRREQRIIALRYGLEDGQPMSLREVGRALNLSGERIRLIERRALTKLRTSSFLA